MVGIDGIQSTTRKLEIVVYAGEDVVLDCGGGGHKDTNNTWTMDGQIMTTINSTKYSFEKNSEDDSFNRKLKIINVDYSDRKVYICIKHMIQLTTTNEFRLRVRDPLGTLWPTLGIIGEAIVLFIIIKFDGYCRRRINWKWGIL